ncbi:MAG: hypothetical protein EA351_05945 [Gemmatimonadales bacterium]|nr:MAG: hypothetical protein EA351_05945 [Gemmatimonadales bacterium]
MMHPEAGVNEFLMLDRGHISGVFGSQKEKPDKALSLVGLELWGVSGSHPEKIQEWGRPD